MAETCTPEQLPQVIERYMRQYGERVEKAVRKDILSVSKEAQDKLRSTSPRRYGSYAESWSRRIQNGSLGSVTTTLYSRLPGLPHLLEFGHALRGVGRHRGLELGDGGGARRRGRARGGGLAGGLRGGGGLGSADGFDG